MIKSVVIGDEARINLVVIGKKVIEIDAVVDTGFTDVLSLPPLLIADLELSWRTIGRCQLADGSEALFDVYSAEIEWDGVRKRVLVDEADTSPVIGMTLLKGFPLSMEVIEKGGVEIEKL